MESNNEQCATCFGEGSVASEFGPEVCPDCCGLGTLPSASVLRERRLRELERIHVGAGEIGRDVHYLVHEVRTAQHALTQIMAAAMERPADDPLGAKIRFLANQFLGFYPLHPHRDDDEVAG